MTRNLSLLLLLCLLFGLNLNAHASAGGGGGFSEGHPNYIALDPAIVVNLASSGKRIHFMQIKAQAMTRSVRMAEALEANKPAIRHALLMLLSHQDAATMRDVNSREKVRAEALNAIRQVIYELTQIGEPPAVGEHEGDKKSHSTVSGEEEQHAAPIRVEDLYFTDFIIQ